MRVAFAAVLACQVFLAVCGIADQWTRGHNGWNGAAYHNAARNTLRWKVLFPLQYETANVPPKRDQLYTHAPLALHLHNVVSVRLFGDRELSIRLVAAVWSVAALVMLFAVVRRLWDDAHALVASAIYVVLPINAIYTNMANHSAGFIFWALLALYVYVSAPRSEPWSSSRLAACVLAFAMAALWDWPAYYVAALIAIDWGWSITRAPTSEARRRRSAQLAFFSAWVAAMFVGHFVLVEALTGNLDELTGTFNARRALSWSRFKTHLLVVPELMFTAPVLAVCAAWVGVWIARAAKGAARPRDLVPLAFLAAGLIHYWTFRWSAIVHSYWAWPLLPGVAIALSASLFSSARFIRGRAGLGASLAVWLLLVPLGARAFEIVPEGRRVGGSMWFFTPVRGAMDTYDSGRPELRFAERVRGWTDRDTGVQLHTSLKARRIEPRFDVTLDRVTHRWVQNPRPQIPNQKGATGWVFVAALDAFDEDQRAGMAASHPYRQYGDYFMLDLRRSGPDIEAWGLTAVSPDISWRLFHSAFEPPVRANRLIEVEQSLRRRFEELDAR